MTFTVNDIFREYKYEFLKKYGPSLLPEELSTLNALVACRTPDLGYRIQKCDCCGTEVTLLNSCRNRHCPLCQNTKREAWLLARKSELPPVPYFHVVFTVPHILRQIFFDNKSFMYSLLFKAASDTLFFLLRDPEYLGAVPGFMATLHTWGQTMIQHPHLHFLVPAGGLSADRNSWIPIKYNDYLMPVKVISKKFSEFFSNLLLERFLDKNQPQLNFNDKNKHLNNPEKFQNFIESLKNRKWVVNSQKPADNPNAVVDYLGRYVYRVAIANSRIQKVENGRVTFTYKDYRDNKQKNLDLTALEFMRRFLLHALPAGFQKIRYYGFLGNNQKKSACDTIRKILGCQLDATKSALDFINAQESPLATAAEFFKEDKLNKCPACEKGRLFTIIVELPTRYACVFKTIKTKYFDDPRFKRGP